MLGLAAAIYATSVALGTAETWHRIIFWGLPSALIVAALLLGPIRNGFFRARLIQHLGDASYAVYLSHVFTLTLAGLLLVRLGLPAVAPPAVQFATLILIALAVGSLVHLLVDRPIQRALAPLGRRLADGR